MTKVLAAKANDDFTLDLKFSDGSVKRFDMKPYLDYEVFQELKNLNYFQQVSVAFGTVTWPHDQDIAPETLFLEGVLLPEDSVEYSSVR